MAPSPGTRLADKPETDSTPDNSSESASLPSMVTQPPSSWESLSVADVFSRRVKCICLLGRTHEEPLYSCLTYSRPLREKCAHGTM